MISKEKTKEFHDKMILWKEFHVEQKVLLFHSCKSCFLVSCVFFWIGTLVVTNIFNHGAIKIQSLETNKVIKLNGNKHNKRCFIKVINAFFLKIFDPCLPHKDIE